MPREIITLQVGQCGNQTGTAFWKAVCMEHAVFDPENPKEPAPGKWREAMSYGDKDEDEMPDELETIGVYFNNSKGADTNAPKDGKYVPRCVIVDLEPGVITTIQQTTPHGKIFDQNMVVAGANGAGNNWAKGHYTEGAEIMDECMDAVRRQIEMCHSPQGFQFFHSLGGGTGSGMGTLLLLKTRDAYPDRITCTYSVFPSPKVSDTVVEPYNAVLSSHQLLENSDETFIIDNEALYNISHNTLQINSPTYAQLNDLVAQTTCGITASLRFPGLLNGDLRKLGVNLVPFPRLHFFLVSQAPLFNADAKAKTSLKVQELATQAYSSKNFLSNVKPDDGKYLAVSFTFRGSMSSEEVDEQMEKLNTKNADDFVDWIPSNIKSTIVQFSPKDTKLSSTMVANTTALKGIFQRLATQFGAMYRRKAFLHWYKGEGMDEMEFQEADKNVRDLITEYQDKQDATYEEEEDEDEEDSQQST
jgi:tubulin beta